MREEQRRLNVKMERRLCNLEKTKGAVERIEEIMKSFTKRYRIDGDEELPPPMRDFNHEGKLLQPVSDHSRAFDTRSRLGPRLGMKLLIQFGQFTAAGIATGRNV